MVIHFNSNPPFNATAKFAVKVVRRLKEHENKNILLK